MKVLNTFLPLLMLCSLLSCSKDHSTNVTDGNWSLYGLSIEANYKVFRTDRENANYFIFSGVDATSPANKLKVYFSEVPTKSGKYEVVKFENNIHLLTNQVGIRVDVPAKGIYTSTGISDNRSWLAAPPIELTIKEGKYKIVIPSMTTKIVNVIGLDTVRLQGTISEY
jgi:hypothetical protein